jgi:desulfoferrodoxin (superoxide reductase-like protein)
MKKVQGLCAALILSAAFVVSAYADKTGVSITGPDTAKKGSTVEITITVTHSANNFMHYTDWLVVRVNGKEASRWDYSSFNRPESERFTRTMPVTVSDTITVEAEGNCNLHGSRGKVFHTIKAK